MLDPVWPALTENPVLDLESIAVYSPHDPPESPLERVIVGVDTN